MDEKQEKQLLQWYEEIPTDDEGSSEHDPYSTDDSLADPEYTQSSASDDENSDEDTKEKRKYLLYGVTNSPFSSKRNYF